ncbi:MAG: retropepsin-like aspartic protease, partial [Chthoniobacteraceae bacterium]
MRPSLLFRFAIFVVTTLAAVAADAAREIPCEYRDGMIWVKVTATSDGVSLNFLLDSGAGASVLDLAAARRIGVKLGRSETVHGVSGRTTAYRVNGFDARTGETAGPASLLALDLSDVSASVSRRIDGLLGADFLRGRAVQIDYAAGRLRLLERAEVSAAGCESLPLVRRNDALCIRVAVAGNSAEWMRVDTGCNSALE